MIAQLDTDYLRLRPAKAWPRLIAYFLFEGRPLTTRGRWINPAVFALFRLWAALPLASREPDVVLILGVGRSGTTLLGKVLGLHRQAGFLNEPKALWQAALGDDDLIGSYSPRAGRYRMGEDDADAAKVRRLRRFYRAFGLISGSALVIDKYPELIFRTGFLARALPHARKIVILRDGWQTAASIAAWSERHGQAARDWWGNRDRKWRVLVDQVIRPDPYFAALAGELDAIASHTDRAAIEWLATSREALRLRAQADEKVLFLNFEDLAADPAGTCARLSAFCGMAPDRAVLDYAARHIAPPRRHARPGLHPVIDAMVAETMAGLGYDTGAAA